LGVGFGVGFAVGAAVGFGVGRGVGVGRATGVSGAVEIVGAAVGGAVGSAVRGSDGDGVGSGGRASVDVGVGAGAFVAADGDGEDAPPHPLADRARTSSPAASRRHRVPTNRVIATSGMTVCRRVAAHHGRRARSDVPNGSKPPAGEESARRASSRRRAQETGRSSRTAGSGGPASDAHSAPGGKPMVLTATLDAPTNRTVARSAVAWINGRRAIAALVAEDARTSMFEIDRGLEPEPSFLDLVVRLVGDRERLLILGPTSVRLALEQAYVDVFPRETRLVDVEPAGVVEVDELLARVRELAA
jgi:hypothetical protein